MPPLRRKIESPEMESVQPAMPAKPARRLRLWTWLLLLAIILAGLALTDILPVRFALGYQAVFLTNGQIYFGKIYASPGRFAVLRDVYYLQVTQPLQNGQPAAGNVNLVKLGGELHGPTDEMRINRENILFTENLRSDSRVVQAIEQLEKK